MATKGEEEERPRQQTRKRKKKGSSSIFTPSTIATSRRLQSSAVRTSRGKSATTTNKPQLSNEKSKSKPHRPISKAKAKSNRNWSKTTEQPPSIAESSVSLSDHNNKPGVGELRRARADYYTTTPEQRSRDVITSPKGKEKEKMPYVGESVVRERVLQEVRYSKRKVGSDRGETRDEADTRRTTRNVRVTEREEDEYVYGRPKETILEEYSTEDEEDVSRVSKSRHTYTRSHQHEDSGSRRKNAPIAETSRSSRRPSTKVESRRSSYRDDDKYSRRSTTTAKTTREEPRRRISADGTIYETRPIKTTHREKIIPLRRQSEPLWRSNPGRQGSESAVEQIERRETSSHHDRPQVRRSLSLRDSQSTHTVSTARPPLQRSKTTRVQSSPFLGMKVTAPEHGIGPKPKKEKAPAREEAKEARREARKHTPLLASIFGAPDLKGVKVETVKKVSCLTCGTDDILYLKTAKLACNHRMCHDCLKRIFTMSVTDPAHMPPRCCTDEHIPLRHVDKLFDDKFKTRWNKKYQEYTTKNRLYCPSRSCGEWIKPSHIQADPHHPGRKFGKCKRCSTKVCTTCNGKYHPSNKECPKDPATAAFVEVAKKEGWQRCYNCSAMVELKEGCNHMTCRCTAEFCMICGAKWKSCDCPWFNYETVENDRLRHMDIPQARVQQVRYAEEMNRRREQEERDEALARRLQVMGIDNEEDGAAAPDAGAGGGILGNVMGIGNAAPNFLNDNFVRQARNLLGGNFRNAQVAATDLLPGRGVNVNVNAPNNTPNTPHVIVPPPLDDTSSNIDPDPAPFRIVTPVVASPPQLLRTPTNASRAFNRRVSRPSERVVPARDRGVGYAEERERHRPGPGPGPGARGVGVAPNANVGRGGAVLVGTPDPGVRERGARIEAWRASILGE